MPENKFTDGFSEITIEKLRKEGKNNIEINLIIELQNSFKIDDITELKKSGLTINSKFKNHITGKTKLEDIDKISNLNCVKTIEVSQKAKYH